MFVYTTDSHLKFVLVNGTLSFRLASYRFVSQFRFAHRVLFVGSPGDQGTIRTVDQVLYICAVHTDAQVGRLLHAR